MAEDNGGAVAPETNALPTAGVSTEVNPLVPQGDGAGGEPQEPASPWDSVEEAGDWKGVPMGARKRIQKLSAEKREMREMIERQGQMIQQIVGHVQSSQPELKREDFASEDEYLDYRMELRERKRGEERQRQMAEERSRQAPVQQQGQVWMGKVEQVKALLPDYDAVVYGAGLNLDPQTAHAIFSLDVGPQVLYSIAKADGLALAMEDMSPAERIAVVRNLEARVRSWMSGRPAAAPATPAVPPPPPRAGSRAQAASPRPKSWIESRNEEFGIH